MIEKLIKKVGKILNYSGDYMPAEAHSGSINRRCPDISKAERELSYKPQVLLKDGLKITIKWYKNHFENGVSKDEFG
jgi:nucleoside-diphosphate-sugar epimerase